MYAALYDVAKGAKGAVYATGARSPGLAAAKAKRAAKTNYFGMEETKIIKCSRIDGKMNRKSNRKTNWKNSFKINKTKNCTHQLEHFGLRVLFTFQMRTRRRVTELWFTLADRQLFIQKNLCNCNWSNALMISVRNNCHCSSYCASPVAVVGID